MDRRCGRDACARGRDADHHRSSRRWKPAHLRGSAEGLPGARRGSDLRGSGSRLRSKRDRTLVPAQRVVSHATRGPVDDRAHRLVEADVHGRARVYGHPRVRHMRDRGAQRQVLTVLSTQRPAKPSRPANLHVHRYLLARSQPLQRASSAHHRPRAAPADRLARNACRCSTVPAQRLHRDSCERRRVTRQRRARPHQRRHCQQRDDQDEHRRYAQQSTLSIVPSRHRLAVSRHDRHTWIVGGFSVDRRVGMVGFSPCEQACTPFTGLNEDQLAGLLPVLE